jgi:hypothetical protein
MTSEILFEPLIPWPWIVALAAASIALVLFVFLRRGRGGVLRALALAVIILGLANPRVILEERTQRPDLAVVVVDESPSMAIANRNIAADAAQSQIVERLRQEQDLDVRVIRSGGEGAGERTELFSVLNRVVAEDVEDRLAGIFLITDGQIHDAPSSPSVLNLKAPAHVLLAGQRGERDRRLEIDSAPAYGLVGSTVDVRFRVQDLGQAEGGIPGTSIPVTAYVDGEAIGIIDARFGEAEQFSLTIPRAGHTVVELVAPVAEDELSAVNNRAAVMINGVRDRLRVLLVSGQPHPGERTWRNLLKSDPGVDLIHFTILRPPDKHDVTPLRELALIVFPVRQLFEEKIDGFDLIIFDRYVLRGVLSNTYLRRVAEYVSNGGALLLSVGPEFAGPRSLARTPLRTVLPSLPTGALIEEPFRPLVTDLGQRHPVTRDLDPRSNGVGGEASPQTETAQWGQWFRTIEADTMRGDEVITGAEGRPLLVVDRVGEGRVAQLMSDQLWLWARGYDGGGPHAELLRRLAHWLMREPELEEERLRTTVAENRLLIERQSMTPGETEIRVTAPDGTETSLNLEATREGIARGDVDASQVGVYTVDDGEKRAMAVVGVVDPPELTDLRATDVIVRPFAEATGGAVSWLEDGLPSIRTVSAGRDTAGRDWIALRNSDSHVISGATESPVLPGWALLILGLGGMLAAWWREGR